MSDPLLCTALARRFHDTYERLALRYGYETRQETRTFDPASRNGQLMIAVCDEIVGRIETAYMHAKLNRLAVTSEWMRGWDALRRHLGSTEPTSEDEQFTEVIAHACSPETQDVKHGSETP